MSDTASNPTAAERLATEVANIDLPVPDDDAEAILLQVGRVLPILAIVVLLITWWRMSGSEYAADQLPMLVSGGLLAIVLTIVGLGLFIRFSIARTLRFWNARQLVEQQAQTDRLVAAIERLELTVRENNCR
jgi:Tfp pilus assembly protein PilN